MKQLEQLAGKFAMKLGLESRPVSSTRLDLTEIGIDPEESDEPPVSSGLIGPFAYRGKLFDVLQDDIKALVDELTRLLLERNDLLGATKTIAQLVRSLNKLQKLINKKLAQSPESNPADTYLYDPVDVEPDLDFEHWFETYLQELDHMTHDELYKERRDIEREMQEFEADEIEIPFALSKRLKAVDKRLKHYR